MVAVGGREAKKNRRRERCAAGDLSI